MDDDDDELYRSSVAPPENPWASSRESRLENSSVVANRGPAGHPKRLASQRGNGVLLPPGGRGGLGANRASTGSSHAGVSHSGLASDSPVAITVCATCRGCEALMSDLEDLCPHLSNVSARYGSCLGACGSGPNCLVDAPRPPSKLESSSCGADASDVPKPGYEDVMLQLLEPVRRNSSNARNTAPQLMVRGRSRTALMTRNVCFEDSLMVLQKAVGLVDLNIPAEALHLTQLKSDALRRKDLGRPEDMAVADELLTECIRLQPESAMQSGRLRELYLLRGEVRGSHGMGRLEEALQDFDVAIEMEPRDARIRMQKAKVLWRSRRSADALACYQLALHPGDVTAGPIPKSMRLSYNQERWVQRNIEKLQERLLVEAAMARGELGQSDAADDSVEDSGDGSGRWKVLKIRGVSWDTCIYHLGNHAPAVPHPYPHDAWHVSVYFGAASRQYTPISTARDWENGQLDLLVKTYSDGNVSKRFATLHPGNNRQPPEEQSCWVMVTAPALTLKLPSLVAEPEADLSMVEPPAVGGHSHQIQHLGIVVGGTGIAPAVQLLREVADANGAFGKSCKATLLYSSRTPTDVFLLDELRAVEEDASGRIQVKHTLTDWHEGKNDQATSLAAMPLDDEDDDDDDDDTDMQAHQAASLVPAQPVASASVSWRQRSHALPYIQDQHYYFRTSYRPYEPESGPLRTDSSESSSAEAPFRGRVSAQMLAEVMPGPSRHAIGSEEAMTTGEHRVVVCGPRGMWESIHDLLLGHGYDSSDLVELRA